MFFCKRGFKAYEIEREMQKMAKAEFIFYLLADERLFADEELRLLHKFG